MYYFIIYLHFATLKDFMIQKCFFIKCSKGVPSVPTLPYAELLHPTLLFTYCDRGRL